MDEFLMFSAKISSNILKTAFLGVSIISLHFAVLLGPQSGIVVWVSYVLGFYAFYLLLNRINNVREILSVVVDSIFKRSKVSMRDASEHFHDLKDSELLVSLKVDSSLEQLLTRILNQYVSNWYSNISSDPCFEHEIRILFQNIASVCYRRIVAVKAEDFVLKKVLPVILDHINAHEKLKENLELSHLHVATHSRKSEILYLQNVSKCLLKYVIPKPALRCKSYYLLLREILSRSLLLTLSDAVCNPGIINTLLLYYLKGELRLLSSDNKTNSECVLLLKNFASISRMKNQYSAIRPDIGTIMKDKDLSQALMHFLKNVNADHLLQFCIDVDSFIERIVKPNLEAEELDCLFRDAWDLYSVYFSNHSPNCIQFEKDYALKLRKALSKDVLKLRTSSILQEAQEHAFLMLDGYCFEFHNSNDFHAWLYGRCESFDDAKSDPYVLSIRENISREILAFKVEQKNVFELSNKLTKIKAAFNSNTILEGQLLNSSDDCADQEIPVELGEDAQLSSTIERHLNTWKVNIPTVGSRLDPITNKAYTVFVIQIQTADRREWLVERRPIDFYSLDVKLNEFHGSVIDAQLPPRRLLTTRLESIQLYEEYLNKLIKNPVLKNSELLHTFLSSIDEFEGEDTSFGKLFRKSMVPSLRKERGQNLEQFLYAFMNSCRTTKYEWKDVSEKQIAPKVQSGNDGLFGNHFNINLGTSMNIIQSEPTAQKNDGDIVAQPSNLCLHLGIKVYHISAQTTKFLVSLLSVFGGVFDQILIKFSSHFFSKLLTSCNVAYLINLIEWAIFSNHSKIDPSSVNDSVMESLYSLKGSWLHPLYVLIHKMIQDPKMNKQLYYRLMDAVLNELFPELRQ